MIEPNDFLEFLKKRRSIRSYQDKMIPDSEINMILEAARWTPSASNRQPWEFIIIKDREILKALSNIAFYGKFLANASIAIAIIGKVSTNPRFYIQDTTLASMNIMLMAWSLGIGTCWIGTLQRERAKEILNIEKNDYLLTILPLGYIEGEIPKPRLRKELKEIIKEI